MPKNNHPIHIIADDRECKSEVIAYLSQIENVELNIRRHSMGDYQIDNRVLVERKTLKDFAISIIDGRLFKQTIRLANSNYKSVLILEGKSGDIAEGSMSSGTSKKFELKLVGVARASLEELLLDYHDFLRQRSLQLWQKNHPKAQTIRKLAYIKNRSYKSHRTYIGVLQPKRQPIL